MKKIVITQHLHEVLEQEKTFLSRDDIKVFIVATHDEALRLHQSEKADLIITHLNTPGMSCERFIARVREDAALRTVSVILVCANTPEAIKASSHYGANAVLLEPVHPILLIAKAQQLLFIAARESLRVILTAKVDGQSDEGPFYCRTLNVSASGMLIETDKRLDDGARLICQFFLPNAKRILFFGKIIRNIERMPLGEEYQYGLMFTDLTPEARKMLEAYVEETSRSAPPTAE